jgi:hypothetical protein
MLTETYKLGRGERVYQRFTFLPQAFVIKVDCYIIYNDDIRKKTDWHNDLCWRDCEYCTKKGTLSEASYTLMRYCPCNSSHSSNIIYYHHVKYPIDCYIIIIIIIIIIINLYQARNSDKLSLCKLNSLYTPLHVTCLMDYIR